MLFKDKLLLHNWLNGLIALLWGVMEVLQTILDSVLDTSPRPSLHPIPGTKPLGAGAALLPPLLYYAALLLLPPAPPPAVDSLIVKTIRNATALVAGVLFLRLSLAYHVPQSIGLTYQLGLVSIYGFCRVIDAFFISPFLFGHIPRRVIYTHHERPETPMEPHFRHERQWSQGGLKDPFSGNDTLKPRSKTKNNDGSRAPIATTTTNAVNAGGDAVDESYFTLERIATGPKPVPVIEHAHTEDGYPTHFADRASWALELETSMRGIGFTWTTADVRHTTKTFLPTVANRVHSIGVHVIPTLTACYIIISTIYERHFKTTMESPDYNPFLGPKLATGYTLHRQGELFDSLSTFNQCSLTLALGGFLMAAFSFGHSLFAIMLHPLSPSPLAFFPPLYTTRVWDLTSVRKFWSFGWHRLFARLFLVYGIWPGEWIERKLTGKRQNDPADVGKVIGAFVSSAFVHSFSVRGVMAGRWSDALGESRFFILNGIAIVLEGAFIRLVKLTRQKLGRAQRQWYDPWIGRVWWISAIVWSGREFARGWVKSGLVREMAFK